MTPAERADKVLTEQWVDLLRDKGYQVLTAEEAYRVRCVISDLAESVDHFHDTDCRPGFCIACDAWGNVTEALALLAPAGQEPA